MDRLIVKNFGPLKDVDIELNKINLFIGENGSGKSVLGKIITIVLDFVNIESIENKFLNLNINYYDNKTVLQVFENKILLLELKNKKFTLHGQSTAIKSLDKIKSKIVVLERLEEDEKNNKNELEKLKKKFASNNSKMNEINKVEKNISKSLNSILDEKEKGVKLIANLHRFTSQYIPAERSFISLFNKSITTLLVADVPLPKFLLAFSSEFEKAGNELKELELLNIKYVNGDGLDRHKVYFNDEDYLSLEHSSSGIQSALPLYLTVKYLTKKHKTIIIEEPEQNLFPKAQSETIKYIIEQVSAENSLFMMTHSPYVLSTLNILMMAHKAGSLGEKAKVEVSELINEKQWINPNEFSAYYLENGKARDIKGRTGLISDNEIDEISDDMTYAFDELLTIYREHKNDK